MIFKIFLGTLVVSTLVGACAHQGVVTHGNSETSTSTRDVAGTRGKKSIRVNPISCKNAYNAALKSASVGTLVEATEVCVSAAQAACTAYVERNSDGPGTGDGRYIAAMCQLSAAYGANKAVNNGKATKGCEAAYRQAGNSPGTGDVQTAEDTCVTEKDAACTDLVNKKSDGPGTGDGHWMAASCELTAAYGQYGEILRMK